MIVFLGDNGPHEEGSPRLAPEFFAANGWGPVERDAGNGRNAGGDGPPIALGGRVYEKGLGVVFQVWGDGEKLYDSGNTHDHSSWADAMIHV